MLETASPHFLFSEYETAQLRQKKQSWALASSEVWLCPWPNMGKVWSLPTEVTMGRGGTVNCPRHWLSGSGDPRGLGVVGSPYLRGLSLNRVL